MRKHFKVAMVAACPFPFPRGTPIRIFRMAEALALRGHEVHVVTYHLGNELDTVPFKIHRIPNIKTYQNCSPGPTYNKLLILDPLLFVKLLKVLKTYDIDLIHAHHYEGLIASLFPQKKLGYPLIYDAHMLLESELSYYKLGLPKTIIKMIARSIDNWLPKQADHIVTVTDEIRSKQIMNAQIKSENITAITSGVECDHFKADPEEYKEYKNEKKTLVFTGTLAPYQGIDLLLRAFNEVLLKRQDVRLLIISNSPFEYYESLANTLNIRKHIDIVNVDFETLPKYLASADIALNPRVDCDGIPQKLLNYMAAGKAIVSFEGSAKNLEHMETGYIVENDNIPAFANAVIQLMDDFTLAQKLGAKARKFVSCEFTWDKVAEKTEAVYDFVLERKTKQI